MKKSEARMKVAQAASQKGLKAQFRTKSSGSSDDIRILDMSTGRVLAQGTLSMNSSRTGYVDSDVNKVCSQIKQLSVRDSMGDTSSRDLRKRSKGIRRTMNASSSHFPTHSLEYDVDTTGDLEGYIQNGFISWIDVKDWLEDLTRYLGGAVNQWARDAFTIKGLNAEQYNAWEDNFSEELENYLNELEDEFSDFESEDEDLDSSRCQKVNSSVDYNTKYPGSRNTIRTGTLMSGESVSDVLTDRDSGLNLADFLYDLFPSVRAVGVDSRDENSIILDLESKSDYLGKVSVEFNPQTHEYTFKVVDTDHNNVYYQDPEALWDVLKGYA